MSLSLSKFKTLKRANIYWIILLSLILLFAIGYQIKAVSGMTHVRHDGMEVHIGAGDNIQSYSWSRPSDATYVVVNVYWKWKGRKCQFQDNETHRVETPLGSVYCHDFGNEELLFGSISCPTSDTTVYSGPERLCGTLQGNFSGSSFNVTVRAVGGGSHFSVVRADWYKPSPTITCWSCNTNNYTCSSQSYSGYYCPSGTYSSSSSCQSACQPPQSITCWSCNTNNYTCSSQSYSGYYCPSGTYSTLSSCQNVCQLPLSPVLNISKTVRNITDNTTFQESISADPLDRIEFNILITSTGSTGAQNVTVKDSLPLHITYQNNLKINGVSSAGDILTGLNLGTISPGQSKVITFEAQVASEDKFIYGITTLTNAAIAYNVNTAKTDTAQIIVPRKAVAGAATEVKTGIVNRALDYILFPLIITFIIILVFKNYLVFLNEWFEKRKNGAIEYRANRALKKVIFSIKSREKL